MAEYEAGPWAGGNGKERGGHGLMDYGVPGGAGERLYSHKMRQAFQRTIATYSLNISVGHRWSHIGSGREQANNLFVPRPSSQAEGASFTLDTCGEGTQSPSQSSYKSSSRRQA